VDGVVITTNESMTMKTTETGGRGGMMIAKTAFEMHGEVDVVAVAVAETRDVRKAQRSSEMLGKCLLPLCPTAYHLSNRIFSGVPLVETTQTPKEDNSRAKREAATADALAKAKAMVEAENAKKVKPEAEAEAETKQEDAEPGSKEGAELKAQVDVAVEADSNVGKPASPASRKRGRDETEDGDLLPEAKRVDSKVEGAGQESMES
jgi:hypothetical protein